VLYRFTTEGSDIGLGQIERGLGLLGFRTVNVQVQGGPEEVTSYDVVFEAGKIGPTGKIRRSDSLLEVMDAEAARQ
jgi:hypothetical protein